ncbi:MAG: methyltransferase domain-containing protein [Acidimicrobiia bacterium]
MVAAAGAELVVFCAGTTWTGQWLADQPMAQELTRFRPVLYVDPPVSLLSPRRDAHAASALEGPRLRRIGERLWRLTPVVPPGRSRPVVRDVVPAFTRRAVRRAVAELGMEPVAVVVASLNPVLDTFPGARRVLYATDDFAAGARLMNLGPERVQRAQDRALATADVVVVVSGALADKWRRPGLEPVVIENGVEVDRYLDATDRPRPAALALPDPVAGFVGNVSDRIDVALLEAVAARGTSLLLVGPRSPMAEEARLEAVLARPNVQWVDHQPYETMPDWVGAMRAGLVPYRVDDFNRASSPLKVLEYLAAGIEAVSSPLPSIVALGDVVRLAEGPADFADAVDAALSATPSPELVARRRAVVADRSWEAAAGRLAATIGIDGPVVASTGGKGGTAEGQQMATTAGASGRLGRTYSARFYEGIDAGSARSAARVVPLVVSVVKPTSVVDVGCGTGTWLAAFKDAGVPDVLGLDGGAPGPQTRIDPTELRTVDLSRPIDVGRTFDLAVTLEVAEHLPASRSASLVDDLCRLAPVVLFSAAIPGQGGTEHVTERWPSYWVELFAAHGYELVDRIRPSIWDEDDVESWYAQNVLLFAAPEARAHLDLDAPGLSAQDWGGRAVVHPRLLEAQHGTPDLRAESPRSLLSMAGRSLADSGRCLAALVPATVGRLRSRA